MATLTNNTNITYNTKTTYVAAAGHNARLMAAVKTLTANGTKAVTLGNLNSLWLRNLTTHNLQTTR